MIKFPKNNMFYSPSTDVLDAVIDEVALEGLDGITLEALWQRITVRLQISESISKSLKEQIWSICSSVKEFIFYELNEPRPPLIIYNRYEFVDPDLGTIIEPDNVPDDIYDYYPIDDIKNGIRGSCKSYYTRKLIESIRNLTLDMVEEIYGSKLVIVASQSARQYALIGDCVCPTLELNVTQYCFLERVGRSRYHGEVTQGKRSLNVLKEDPKTLFYHRKLLLKHKLITKQMHYQRSSGHGTSGSLLHLPRFYVERKPKMIYLAETIVELLKTRENNLADYAEIRSILGLESSIKHLFRTAFFQRVVRTDLIVPYRTLYPDAKESEWQRKNCHSREKRIRAVQLLDPSIDINDLWIKDDGIEEEDVHELNTSNQNIHEPFLQQANKIVENSNYNGLSQNELSQIMGIPKLQSRTIFRNLSKIGLVAIYMNDIGRQRITRYVSKKFEKNSSISMQFQMEMEKMKELTKKSSIENEQKTLPTTKEFFYPSPTIQTKKDDHNSKVDIQTIDEPMDIEQEKPPSENRKNLFSTINNVLKKYKLHKCTFKYKVLYHNVHEMKDLPTKLNKLSNKPHNSARKRIKLSNVSSRETLETQCDVALQETKILDESCGDIRCSIRELSLSDPKNTGTVTYRILKRANMIIEAVKEHVVIDDITKLMKMINEEEEREGYDVKIDKKSLVRLLQKLSIDNLIKNIKLTLSANNTKKVLIFICDPTININHSVIQSAVEQAKIKFCLMTSASSSSSSSSPNKRKLLSQSNGEFKNEREKIIPPSKQSIKLWTNKNSKIIPTNLVINSRAGKDYGYSPKFIRMKIMHQLMYYLIYDHPGELISTRDEQINELRSRGHEIDDKMLKEMGELFSTQVDWKMFIPPLPTHNGWPEGWTLFCDLLLRIPLSLFLKVYNVSFVIPDLEYYRKHPIRQHYLVKDLPTPLRNALLMKRRYIFVIHETITRLCFIGLVQFGPQKLKEKDQVFIYLNRRSELMDTTSSAASYHKIEEKEYPVTKYLFDKMQTVEKYWYDMWHICINTRLGGRLAVMGTDIVLEELSKKIEMMQTLKPRLSDEAVQLDLGLMPGDKKGAAGIDSAFFAHLKRNWNWENLNGSYNTSNNKNETRNNNNTRKTHISKVRNKAIKLPEYTGLNKNSGPTPVDIKNLKNTKKSKPMTISKQKLTNAADKLLRLKLITSKTGRKQNTVVRRVLPRKRKTRCRVKYDDVDYSALQKMNKLRVDWNPSEDNILLVCKVVMMYLSKNPRSQPVSFATVRNVLRLYSLSSYNKTSRACQRRLLYMLKQPQTIDSVALGVEELKQNYFIKTKYGDVVDKIRKSNNPNELDEKLAEIFKNLVAYVAKKYYDISQTQSKETKYKPNTVQEFNLVYEINHLQKSHGSQGFSHHVKNVNDIHGATINSVIYSSMCCGKDRKSWAYQLFRIYQQYPEILLRNAMGKIRSDQMVSIKRNYVSAFRKYGNCMPMSSSQYQLSTSYIYKFQTKLPTEVYGEVQDYFSRLINGYVDGNLNEKAGGVQVFPPTGGMIVAIPECLVQNKIKFNIEIPDHVITLLDPKLEEHDETYMRISKRYQDILASLEEHHVKNEQPTESQKIEIHKVIENKNNNDNNDDADDNDDDDDDDDDIDDDDNERKFQTKKQHVFDVKTTSESTAIGNKQSSKKSIIRREHWGWGMTKFSNKNDDNIIEENDENSDFDDDNDTDCQCIKLQDGGVITITKEDVKRAKATLIDDSIHQAFLKTHTHLTNNFLDSSLIGKLNEMTNNESSDVSPMDVDTEEKILDQSLSLSSHDRIPNESNLEERIIMTNKHDHSNFCNDIIKNMVCEIESKTSCCKKNAISHDVRKSGSRIALLKMREELNEDLPDSHHAQEYFVISTFGIYYSLPDIDKEKSKNSDFIVDNQILNQILLLKDEDYNRVVDDLIKYAVFPKDFPDYCQMKNDLEQQENISSSDIDLIFDYVREKRERGATLKELKMLFYKKIGNQIYDILYHMTDKRLFLRSGVTEMHYIHHNFIDPWIIQSIRIMRLQREGLPTIPPGSVYVLTPQNNDKSSCNNDINDYGEVKDDENLSANENNSTNTSNGQKNICKNRRTCLLQTKEIYTAAKKLDLNSAEDIHVVIRPWIQIDGVINRNILGKMLGAILAHCIMNPGIILSQIQLRFYPALQPYHVRELVEILVKLDCLTFKLLVKINSNLFTKSSSTRLSYPAKSDGSSSSDNELILEPTVGATLKFAGFLQQYQTKIKSFPTDSNDFI